LIQLPAGAIEIAQSCSGLHALIVGLALAALNGELSAQPLRRRLTWLGVMGTLALITNWLRIFTVIVAAYATDMHTSLVRHHYWLGWGLFAVALAGFLWWTERSAARGSHAHAPEGGRHDVGPRPLIGNNAARVAVTLAILAVLPLLAYGMDWAHSGATTAVTIEWPAPPKGWTASPQAYAREWIPHFVDPSAESFIRYTDAGGEDVEAFAVANRVQSQDTKLVSYRNNLLGDTGYLRGQSVRIVDSPSGRWRETLAVDATGRRSLIWSRYRVGTRLFVRPHLSQLWYGLAAFAQLPLYSLTALHTACESDCNAARARLNAAATWLQPTLR
ncbi:MAG: exosortase-associated EpsI family protein, partial [Steroidobacteraceae bacterium]